MVALDPVLCLYFVVILWCFTYINIILSLSYVRDDVLCTGIFAKLCRDYFERTLLLHD